LGIGGLGIGDWGFGDWAQSPIPDFIFNLLFKIK